MGEAVSGMDDAPTQSPDVSLPVKGTCYTVEVIDGDAWVIWNHAGSYGNGWVNEPPSAEQYATVRDLIKIEDGIRERITKAKGRLRHLASRVDDYTPEGLRICLNHEADLLAGDES